MKIAKFEFSLFGINTYVVWDEKSKECAIIDPGMINAREEDAMKAFINREGLHVEHIINTHLHIDHAIGDSFAVKEFSAPVEAHRGDDFLLANIKRQALEFQIEKDVEAVSVSTYLEEGDNIKIGEGILKVLHVPGHSKGSIALYDPQGRYVIVGDALFYGSVGRTDLPGGDMDELIDSIRSKLLTLPDETVVYPGHGPATTIGREKRMNPFLQIAR